ncbi:hypothetical protein D9M73_62730 [compost metagenome]
MVLLFSQQAGTGNQVPHPKAARHVDGHAGQAGYAALHELGAGAAQQSREELLLGLLGAEVVAQALHHAVHHVVQVLGERQPAGAGHQEQHGQRQQRGLTPFGAAGSHAAQHFHIVDGVAFEGEEHATHGAARPLRLRALVVDELGFLHRALSEGGRVVHALVHGSAVGSDKRRAAIELLGQAEHLAPCQRQLGHGVAGGGGRVADFGTVARLQRGLALRLGHELEHLLRGHDAVFLGLLQRRIQHLVAGGLLQCVAHGVFHLYRGLGDAAVLAQPREGDVQGLHQIDHRRRDGSAQVLREKQASNLLGFLLRVFHIVHELHGGVFQLALALGNVLHRLGDAAHVQAAGGLAGV